MKELGPIGGHVPGMPPRSASAIHYLMILDVAIKYFIVHAVNSLNSETMIQTLTSVFSEQGLPREEM